MKRIARFYCKLIGHDWVPRGVWGGSEYVRCERCDLPWAKRDQK